MSTGSDWQYLERHVVRFGEFAKAEELTVEHLGAADRSLNRLLAENDPHKGWMWARQPGRTLRTGIGQLVDVSRWDDHRHLSAEVVADVLSASTRSVPAMS